MRDEPSEDLLQKLERLKLATPEQVAAVAGRARRLVRGLPLFDSVWVDALAQARVLTPFQAREFNAGRGESLRVSDYIIKQPLRSPAYARIYRARHIATSGEVRLLIADIVQLDRPQIEKQIKSLVALADQFSSETLLPVRAYGFFGDAARPRLWCVCDDTGGVTVAEWLIPHGRLPPAAALDVARQMAVALAELERFDTLHGDVGAVHVVLNESGQVQLPMPGLRAILRPEEGYGHADLAPEAYDYVAPERITDGTASSTASELYACGSFWWHLLTGRPPVPGGDSLAKLRNVQKGKIPDVRQLAPETLDFFAEAIKRCTQLDPAQRGTSLADLAEQLDGPTRHGCKELAGCVRGHNHPAAGFVPDANILSGNSPAATRGVLALAAMICVAAVGYLLRGHLGADAPTVSLRTAEPPAATEPSEHKGSAEDTPSSPRLRGEGPGVRGPRDLNVAEVSHAEAAAGRLPMLRPGITVRGDPADRPRVLVPRDGLTIDQPHTRFENLDFVFDGSSTEPAYNAAMIRLESHWVEFHRCSFQSTNLSFGAPHPVVLAWDPKRRDAPVARPTSVRVIMDQCVVRGVAAGVDLRQASAATVESLGTLFLGPGPLLRLAACPKLDQPVTVSLDRVTVRGATALLMCSYDRMERRPGKISINTDHCVFATQVDGALIVCEGADDPRALFRFAQWSGQSSLLAEDRKIALWQSPNGDVAPVDVADLLIDGLTRSHFEFVSPEIHLPAASRLREWVAPLRGPHPPGIDDAPLHMPDLAPRK